MSAIKELEITGNFYGITSAKGSLIVNDGTKNIDLPVGADGLSLIADSTLPAGIKWASAGSINNIVNTQITLSTLPISSNSTTPVAIAEFNNTPIAGTYLIIANVVYSESKSNRTITFGMYNNGVLITASGRTYDSTTNLKIIYQGQFVQYFNGTDAFSLRFNVNDVDTTATIHSGNLILIKFTNVTQLNTISPSFATNSTTAITIDNTTTTPASGNYVILFNCVFTNSQNNRTATFELFRAGVLISGTSTTLGPQPNIKTLSQISFVAGFSGSQQLSVRVYSSNNANTVTVFERNLILIPIS